MYTLQANNEPLEPIYDQEWEANMDTAPVDMLRGSSV